MKKNKTKIDRSIDTDVLGFQDRESYKAARTNIAYSILKKGCKKVAFTSSTKSEGKTVTSINVASALAQQVDTKVLVVECDLRRPRVNTALKIEPTPGLTNYLNDECSLEDIIKDTKIDNLKAIAYGAIPPVSYTHLDVYKRQVQHCRVHIIIICIVFHIFGKFGYCFAVFQLFAEVIHIALLVF